MTDNKEMNDWYRANQDKIDAYIRGFSESNVEDYDVAFLPPSTMNHSLGNPRYRFPRNLNDSLYWNQTLKYNSLMWLKDGKILYDHSKLFNSYFNNIKIGQHGQPSYIDFQNNEMIDCDFSLAPYRKTRFSENDILNSKFKLIANDNTYSNEWKTNTIVGCEFKDSIVRRFQLDKNIISSSQFINNSFLDSYWGGNLVMDSSFDNIKLWRMRLKMRNPFATRNTTLEELDSIIRSPRFLNCSFNKVNFKESNFIGTSYFEVNELNRNYGRSETDLLDDFIYQNIYLRFEGCDFDEVKMDKIVQMEKVQFSNCTFNKLKLNPSYYPNQFWDIDMKDNTFNKCDFSGSLFHYKGNSTSRGLLRRYLFFSKTNRNPRLEEWKYQIEQNKYLFPRTIQGCTFNNCSFKEPDFGFFSNPTFKNAILNNVDFNFKRERGFSDPKGNSYLNFEECRLMDVRFEDSDLGVLQFYNCILGLSFKGSNILQLNIIHDTTLEFARRVINLEGAVVSSGKIDGLFERYNFTNATFGDEYGGVDFSNSDITPEKLESVGATFSENCIFPNEEELEEAEADSRRSAIDQLALRPNDSDNFVVDDDEYDDYEDNEPLGNNSDF